MDMYKEGTLDLTEMILQLILCPPDQREAMNSLAKDRIKNHYLFAFESVCRFSEVWGPWVSGTRERQRLGDKGYCSTGLHFQEPAVKLLPHRTLCKTAWEEALHAPAYLESSVQQAHGHNQHWACGRLSHPREGWILQNTVGFPSRETCRKQQMGKPFCQVTKGGLRAAACQENMTGLQRQRGIIWTKTMMEGGEEEANEEMLRKTDLEDLGSHLKTKVLSAQ